MRHFFGEKRGWGGEKALHAVIDDEIAEKGSARHVEIIRCAHVFSEKDLFSSFWGGGARKFGNLLTIKKSN